MARRSDHTREELIALAVREGLALVDEKGFPSFSARGAAARMGYTVGTLYHVFGSLDEYILHINAATLDGWFEDMGKTSASKLADIRYLASSYRDFAHSHTNRWLALFEHRMAEDKPVPLWYAEKMARFFALVERALLPHVANNSRKARRHAKILWAGIHGICILSVSGKLDVVEAETADVLIKHFLDTYLAGLSS